MRGSKKYFQFCYLKNWLDLSDEYWIINYLCFVKKYINSTKIIEDGVNAITWVMISLVNLVFYIIYGIFKWILVVAWGINSLSMTLCYLFVRVAMGIWKGHWENILFTRIVNFYNCYNTKFKFQRNYKWTTRKAMEADLSVSQSNIFLMKNR